MTTIYVTWSVWFLPPQVDTVPVDPTTGASYAGGDLRVMMNGQYSRVETSFGLVVENDGSWTTLVKMPTTFSNMTDGLCGNNNGDAEDDLVTKDGVDVTGTAGSYSVFANSFLVEDAENPK